MDVSDFLTPRDYTDSYCIAMTFTVGFQNGSLLTNSLST